MINPLTALNPFMNYIKIAAVAAVFLGGLYTGFHIQQSKIDKLHEQIGGYEETISSMQALITESNTKLEEINKEATQRAEIAADAIKHAQDEAAEADAVAHAILNSKPPKGSKNRCTAARDAFAQELRKERGIK
jgi:hypothetical protein